MLFTPIYKKRSFSKLNRISNIFFKQYSKCSLCPNNCNVDRFELSSGLCRETYKVKIASYNLHYGEEPVISGKNGSGTIFFSGCSLSCVFCQNYPISQLNYGNINNISQLTDVMLYLQKKGANNINLVTPTHFAPSIFKSILLASKKGLKIPIAYNTSGYEKSDIMRNILLFTDIFLFDFKYVNNKKSLFYSNVKNYFKYSLESLKTIYNHIGDQYIIQNGILKRGIIIRHLILPSELENSKQILTEISRLSKNIHISLMSQYFPAYNAFKFKNLSRKLQKKEYYEIINFAVDLGFKNLYIQELN